ncbi:BspA family leucine-rich repeat surface protein [Mycoplasma yeatsii]|uniref:BspA family leucine-rich repeat surface protein n=1 Tax=Mycoplasma yeatsii TaxID=51365 RepID=UPI0005B2473D|nr:BspA family leucine-rich repeat surface protein [Mycoplasma yeatsii]AJM71889.1 membrane protein [Mycoplasma yeatsii GM274B]
MKKLLCILTSIMGTSLAVLPTACETINTQKDDSKTNVEEQIKQLKEEQEKHLKLISQLTEQINQLTSDKTQLENQLQAKEQEINDYQEMIQKNGELTKLLGDEISKMEKQYNKEVIENQQVVEKITKALEEYVKLIEKHQTSSMVFLQLHRNTIAELNQRIQSKDLKITDLTRLKQELTNNNSSLQSQLSSTKQELETLRSQNTQNINALRLSNEKVAKLEGELSTLRSEFSQLEQTKTQLENQLQQKEQEINDYKEMLQKNGELTKLLGDEIEEIKRQYNVELIENQQTVRKITKALEEYVKLIEKYKNSSEFFEELNRKAIAKFKEKIQSKDLQIADLTRLKEELTDSNSSLQSQLSSTKQELANTKQRLEQQITQLTQDKQRLSQQLQQKEQEFQREKQRLERELGSKTTEIERIKTELSTLRTRAGQLETQNQELNTKWQALNAQFNSTKQQLDTVTRERNEAKQALETANSNLASARRTLEKEQQKAQRLETELSSIKGKISSEEKNVKKVWDETIKNTGWENETYSNLFNRFNKELNKRDDIEFKYKLADISKAGQKVKSADKQLIIKNKFTEIKLDLGKVYALKQTKQEQGNELKAFGYDEKGKMTEVSKNINKVPEYLPWFITDLTGIFIQNTSNQIKGLEKWNTENVTNMTGMFSETPNFNQSLNHFNTSNVTDMNRMFDSASKFNGDISNWDTSKVKNMEGMFAEAVAFNKEISTKEVEIKDNKYIAWNVSNVINMSDMFAGATAFNKNISSWDTIRVNTMDGMFERAKSFDQNISNWNVNNVATNERFTTDAHEKLDHTRVPDKFAIKVITIELAELFRDKFKNKITSNKTYNDILEDFKKENKLSGVFLRKIPGVDPQSKPKSNIDILIEVVYKSNVFQVGVNVGTIK